jgi:hypothetical protein
MNWIFVPVSTLDFVPTTVSRLSFGRDDLARFDLEHYTMLLERTPVLPAVYLAVDAPGHIDFLGPDGVLAIARRVGRSELFVGARFESEEAEEWLFGIKGVRRADDTELAAAWHPAAHLMMFAADVPEPTLRRIGLDLAHLLRARFTELGLDSGAPKFEPELEILARGVVVRAATPTDDGTARRIVSFVGQVDTEVARVASYNGLRWPLL